MYNNLTQQNPYYYGYGAQPAPQYQRAAIPQPEAPQVQPYAQMNINYIKGRPVVSIDEARASQIDLDGSLYVFPDLGNKRIYTKQINLDGTASFNVFELAPQTPQSAEGCPEYVTKAQLEEALNELRASLNQPKVAKPSSAQFNL